MSKDPRVDRALRTAIIADLHVIKALLRANQNASAAEHVDDCIETYEEELVEWSVREETEELNDNEQQQQSN